MSYFDGPNRTMPVMNVPVEVSNLVTPFSMPRTQSWYLGSSRSSTAILFLPVYSSVIRYSAWMPEFDLVGSVWPSLTKPQRPWPPTASQPLGEVTASWIVFHEIAPPDDLTSASARSSHATNTSG